MESGFVKRVVDVLVAWRRLTEEAERTLVDNLAATAPWLAPLAPAYLAYQAMLDVLRFPFWVAAAVGLTVEVLGISTINTALTFWTWNREKNKSDKTAPTWAAILAAAFYVAVVITVNVLLDGGAVLEKVAKGLISSLSVAAAITLALRSQHTRRVLEKHQLYEERRSGRRERKLQKLADRGGKLPQFSVKVSGNDAGQPETFGKWANWKQVPREERFRVARMTDVRQVMAEYGVSERTGYNWMGDAQKFLVQELEKEQQVRRPE